MDVSFKRLIYLAKNMNSSEIEEFENLLSKYVGKNDEKTLEKLLGLFNDENPFYDVMYSLVHLVESWPIEIYIKTLIETFSLYLGKAPFWMDCLFNRIFNNPQSFLLFQKNMHLASKKDLLQLFDLMEEESSYHKIVISKLRQELESMKP